MSSAATVTTLTLGAVLAALAAAVVVTREVTTAVDAAIAAGSDEITLDDDA